MEDQKESKNSAWLSVPQFGDWDQKGGTIPDYSMDFSKIREMRKLNKRDPSRASLGNEEDLINPFHNQPTSSDHTKAKLTTVHSDNNNHNDFSHHHPHSPSVRLLTSFQFCYSLKHPFSSLLAYGIYPVHLLGYALLVDHAHIPQSSKLSLCIHLSFHLNIHFS